MHSSHKIGYPSIGILPPGAENFSNHISGVSSSIAEESFSRALASAIAHTATVTGSTAQDTRALGEGAQQRSVAAIVAGAHGTGDAAVFSRVVKISGHVQWRGRADISAFSADAQAKHGDRWHHELKPIGPGEVA